MDAFLTEYGYLLAWMGALSLLTLVATAVIVPLIVLRIPVDYFSHRQRHVLPWGNAHPVARWLGLILKNLLGYILILMGIITLVLPGQGLLTLFIGLMLINFPGKFQLERRMVGWGPVFSAINWLRKKAGREPLAL